MSLKQELQAWDGKTVNVLENLFSQYENSKDWPDSLLDCFNTNATVQNGVTWLLKKILKQGGALKQKQIVRIFSWLNDLECWEARLHILQSLQWLKIPKFCKKDIEHFLRESFKRNQKNKFVRAWAYNGFYLLGIQYPEYQEEAKKLLDGASQTEAPSVKARIRQIQKNG